MSEAVSEMSRGLPDKVTPLVESLSEGNQNKMQEVLEVLVPERNI